MYDFSRLSDYLDTIPRQGFAPGCDTLIMQNHRPLYRHMSGSRGFANPAPIDRDTVYYLYSCTKPITVAGAMALYEQGRFSMEDPLCRYLPEFREAYLPGENGEKITVGDKILLRHLFTMTAGFDYDLTRPAVRELLRRNPDCTTREFVGNLVKEPLVFMPGERFQYSLCHDILGAVVEVISDMNFGDYLKKAIFDPLGMEKTYFAKKGEYPANLAEQYYCWDDVNTYQYEENDNIYVFGKNYQSGGAGLFSTTEDYALFADAMACGGAGGNGRRILKSETVDFLRTERLSSFVRENTFGCAAGGGYGYGYGVRTRTEAGTTPLGEFGWDGAAGAYLLCDPKNRVSIVYMQHVQGWPNRLQCHEPLRDLAYEAMGLAENK